MLDNLIGKQVPKAYQALYVEDHYLRVIVEGERAADERWWLWERDVVEDFIQPALQVCSRYYEFEVAPNNQWLDLETDLAHKPLHNAGWNSGFEHATRINSSTYIWTTKMRIPAARGLESEFLPLRRARI